jgi:hypothetical protein
MAEGAAISFRDLLESVQIKVDVIVLGGCQVRGGLVGDVVSVGA